MTVFWTVLLPVAAASASSPPPWVAPDAPSLGALLPWPPAPAVAMLPLTVHAVVVSVPRLQTAPPSPSPPVPPNCPVPPVLPPAVLLKKVQLLSVSAA